MSHLLLGIGLGVVGLWLVQRAFDSEKRRNGDDRPPYAGKGDTKRSKEVDKRRIKTFPAPYPNGWYKVADSTELKPGTLKEVRALGQNLVVFRGEATDGAKAHVLDAECPHLGANLTQGGRVVGDCVECPWHKWKWRGSDGTCAHIPYQSDIPSIAKTRSWEVREVNKMVLVWWHDQGKPPEYEPEVIDTVETGTFRYVGSYNRRVKMHLQDFVENTADWQHFEPIHGRLRIPWTSIIIPGIRINHKAEWRKGDDSKPHQCWFRDDAYLEWKGKRIPRTDARGDTLFDGPGSITIFQFTIEDVGEPGKPCIVLFHTHLPLKPLMQQVEFRYYAHPSVSNFIVNYIVGNWVNQWWQDVEIWENKVFQMSPLVVKNDGPIMALRRWFLQFYSQPSKESQTCNSKSICNHPEWLDW
eukprot:TRINITY_DN8390_c0_g1_i1.p1 TRINITY_DN8390_c0_g1~~TRINITY_DN8390_c0_g1_i1.p1  ORF type:complete len:460 (+),score=77.04 TRINITY_DN8390_c0_g1_i1:144-1382(+)